MERHPTFYVRPSGERFALKVAPRLASWNRSDHPDQLRLTAALEHAVDVLGPKLGAVPGPVAVRLDVALPTSTPLLDEHDLDNYLYPLASHLAKHVQRVIVSAWCSKFHGDRSFLAVEQAVARKVVPDDLIVVRTTASGSTTAYKEQIREQLHGSTELPDGPVSLELAFVVGPTRNWLNLWKPTIDSLEPLLGRTRPNRAWHPRDGRITDLGLHLTVDPAAGNDVMIAICRGNGQVTGRV